jgi:hypothetical protein
MSALSIEPTFPIFTDIDGQPLEAGYVWIGTANLDPQTNPINVYWDAALTIAAPQPIRTLAGYPSRNGTPARLYVNSDYSIRVMNKNGSTVYSAPAFTERISSNLVTYQPPFIGGVATTIQDKLAQTVSVKDFGAVGNGVTDDTAAIQAAHNTGKAVFYPNGTYLVTSTITIANLDFGMVSENAVLKCGTDNLTPMFSITNASKGLVKGLVFDANALGKGFVHVTNCPNLQISGNTFHNFKEDPSVAGNFSAVQIALCPNSRITNNFFYDLGQNYGGSSVQPSQYRAITQNTSCDKTIVANNVFQSVFGAYFLAEFPVWASGASYVVNNRVLVFETNQWNIYRCVANNTASVLNSPPNASFWALQYSDVEPTASSVFDGNICRNVRDNSVYFIENVRSITVTSNTFISSYDETIVVVGENITITGNSFINTRNKAISLELGAGNIDTVTISGNSFIQNASFFSIGVFIAYRNATATNKIRTLSITGNNFKSEFSVANASYITLRHVDNLVISGNVFEVGAVDSEIVIRAFNTVVKGLVSNNVFSTASNNARAYQNESASSDVLIVSNMMNGRILANNTSELIQLGYIEDTGSNIYLREPISRLVWANEAPTTGNWTRGDIVFSQFPAASGFIGWVLTNNGWKTFGAISA